MKNSYSSEVLGWVETIKVHHSKVNESDKQIIFLKKRTIEDALVCGEYLTKCKEALGHGSWGEFIKTEFSGCFGQKTATRYMKLFLSRDVVLTKYTSLKMAYVEMGIMKEVPTLVDEPLDGQIYTDDSLEDGDNTPPTPTVNPPVSVDTTPKVKSGTTEVQESPVVTTGDVGKDDDDPTKPPTESTPPSTETKVETTTPTKKTPRTSGFVVVFKPTPKDARNLGKPFIEFRLTSEGGVEGFNLKNGESLELYQQDLDDLFQALTPYVDWYHKESQRRKTTILERVKDVPVSLEDVDKLLAA